MAIKNHEYWMEEAIAEAKKAQALNEVPIGAIVVVENKVIARAHNFVESKKDATAHAEILAIQEASRNLNSWRLEEASLFVTLEPCTMCIGAMILARIKNLYFGCYDPRQGAVGSIYDLSAFPALPHAINVYPEVLKDQCLSLLSTFFQSKR